MKCDKCNNAAAYSRKYSGESLCAPCFSNSILQKTAKTISKHKMIKKGDLVGVAVSGGKDSLSLLHVLKKMSKSHDFQLKAITIDEGIPGYRDEALEIVKNFCSNIGVDYKVFSYNDLFDITLNELLELKDKKTSSCSICGTLRRRAIDFGAKDLDVDVVATGHNLDDTLQTFVINILSGDTNKIGWMDPDISSKKIGKIKPFCEIYENEIVFYAFVNDIPFQSEQCPHMNQGIRTEIREFLNSLENNHIGIKNNMYRSFMKISPLIKDFNHKKRKTCSKCGNDCTGDICSVCNMLVKLKQGES